ncbi:hypothetical protein C8R46DRAFT_1215182 [Mycena filopes]|nr:hypothetical protein C8R46DRAFT_1215182 [Mycena filopes]
MGTTQSTLLSPEALTAAAALVVGIAAIRYQTAAPGLQLADDAAAADSAPAGGGKKKKSKSATTTPAATAAAPATQTDDSKPAKAAAAAAQDTLGLAPPVVSTPAPTPAMASLSGSGSLLGAFGDAEA